MDTKKYNVLFLCTANSARSIFAEALMNELGRGRFRAFSAGSHPAGKVHDLTIETLRSLGLPTEGLRSKSWDEFASAGAPELNFVFTVCDNAAGEQCPHWPGQPITAHWGVEDPAAVTGPDDRKRAAFQAAAFALRRRIESMLSLPLASLDSMTIQNRLRDIGKTS